MPYFLNPYHRDQEVGVPMSWQARLASCFLIFLRLLETASHGVVADVLVVAAVLQLWSLDRGIQEQNLDYAFEFPKSKDVL
jgi:hypothetical protein